MGPNCANTPNSFTTCDDTSNPYTTYIAEVVWKNLQMATNI